MAIIKVKTGGITADAITDALIADDVVGTEHLTANEVDTTALGADAVTGAQLADDAVNSEHYTDGSVDTAHIADAQITTAKLSTAVFTGATDIGADIADADLFLVDDGAGGTIRKTAASRLKTYVGGGITNVDMHNMSTQTLANGAVFASGWSRETVLNGMPFGTGVTESSGVFTFPNTGLYKIDVYFYAYKDGALSYVGAKMEGSSDGFSSNSQSLGKSYGTISSSSYPHTNVAMNTLYKIDNTSNNKFRLKADSSGEAAFYETYIIFTRLSDG